MQRKTTENRLKVENVRVTRSRSAQKIILTESAGNVAAAVKGNTETPVVRINLAMKRKRGSSAANHQKIVKSSLDGVENPKRRTSLTPTATAGPSSVSDSDDIEVYEIVWQLVKIKDILGKDYVDVANRLRLDTVPYCVQNQSFCRTHHHRKCPRPRVVDRLQSAMVGTFSKQNRRLHYLKSVQDMCIRMEFPGDEVITNLMEMILIAQQPKDAAYSSDYLLQNCVVVAETILMKFPPCWPDINEAYHKVLMADVDVKKYFPKHSGSKQNIIVFLMDILANTITSVDEVENPSTMDSDDSDSDDYGIDGFNGWLQRTSAEENFTQHTRTEKIDRLFSVLHILTKILEHDFSIWMLRYPSKPEHAMFSNTSPLIARVFFDGTYRQITSSVKKLLEIFVFSVCNAYPKDKVDILSRIVALLSVAINLCQKQSNSEVIQYPFVQTKALDFAKEIFKTIIDTYGYKVPNLLAVINAIRVPFIKYLLIEQLLYKLNPAPGDMCVRKIFNNFEKNRWEQCEEGLRPPNEIPTTTKYPISPKNKPKPKTSSIYRNEYLDILLAALRAYCETHRVRDVVYQVFANKTVESTPPPDKPEEPLKGIKLDIMEQDISILERRLKRKQPFVRYKFEEMSYGHIHVDRETMIMYRDDVKYLGLLLKLIRDLRKKNETIFENWYTFLNTTLDT